MSIKTIQEYLFLFLKSDHPFTLFISIPVRSSVITFTLIMRYAHVLFLQKSINFYKNYIFIRLKSVVKSFSFIKS
ncbi:hypothetical protein C7M87_04910 [Klebsiella pneumoniae]|nr:hypothetical protein C7M87_04910 [Klebsiella pneumoniae]